MHDVQGGRTDSGSSCCWAQRGICRGLQWLPDQVGLPGCTPGWDALHLPGPSPGRSGSAIALPVFPWAAGRWFCCPGCTAAACSLLAAPLALTLALWLKPPRPALGRSQDRREGRGLPSEMPCLTCARTGTDSTGYPGACPDAAGARSPAGAGGARAGKSLG